NRGAAARGAAAGDDGEESGKEADRGGERGGDRGHRQPPEAREAAVARDGEKSESCHGGERRESHGTTDEPRRRAEVDALAPALPGSEGVRERDAEPQRQRDAAS